MEIKKHMEVRESFVMHTEWVEDLPEEYKSKFLTFIYNYGSRCEEPELKGLEQTLWIKIKRRMDEDQAKWEKTKQRRSEAGKLGATKRWHQEAPAPAEKKETKRFKKPTEEEIRNYCTERNNTVDAQRFYNFYEANGWKVGKNPMKDWKAAVRIWEQRQTNYNARCLPDDRLTL